MTKAGRICAVPCRWEQRSPYPLGRMGRAGLRGSRAMTSRRQGLRHRAEDVDWAQSRPRFLCLFQPFLL